MTLRRSWLTLRRLSLLLVSGRHGPDPLQPQLRPQILLQPIEMLKKLVDQVVLIPHANAKD
jgi:hypothetical protein